MRSGGPGYLPAIAFIRVHLFPRTETQLRPSEVKEGECAVGTEQDMGNQDRVLRGVLVGTLSPLSPHSKSLGPPGPRSTLSLWSAVHRHLTLDSNSQGIGLIGGQMCGGRCHVL